MGKSDKRVELYINKCAEFAQPILWRITEVVHKACPDVEETLKWGMPYFTYKGSNLCGMAAFKQHCVFGFWMGSKMKDPNKILRTGENKTSMGNLGRMTSIKDLPSDKILISYIREAMSLIDKGVKLDRAPAAKQNLKVPAYFSKALSKNKKALAIFENFSPSRRKEYIEWITEARTEETRNTRMKTAIGWISEGKSRHWKYKR